VNIYAEEESQFFRALPATSIRLNGEDEDMPDMSGYGGIACKFGRFGQTKATFVNSTMITCFSPTTNIDRDDLYEETVTLQVAMNGVDFGEDSLIDFTFYGNGSWFGFTGVVVAILLLGALFAAIVYFLYTYFLPRGDSGS